MKIIFASKFYYITGGLESYLFRAKQLLEANGHEVIPFSTNHPDNYKTVYSKYFCKHYELSREGRSRSIMDNIKAVINMVHNRDAYLKMKQLILDTKPDIVQGFGVTRHLSYSIFKASKELNIPTIMRQSDYALLCPVTSALDGWGRLCPDFSCSKGNLTKILKRRCIHDSFVTSFIGNLEHNINLHLKTYKRNIDYYIAPSLFLRDIFIKHYGVSPDRIFYLPVFIDSNNVPVANSDDGYFLYAGRLTREKGVATLLKAIKKDSRSKLVIAGFGTMEDEFKKYAEKNNINVHFAGYQNFDNLQELIKRSRAVIVPSEWYENSPNIVLEANTHGKPVIGANIGGIPEMIEDNLTGLIFEMGNSDDLCSKIKYLMDNPNKATEMGKRARLFVEQERNAEKHYQSLMEIYNSAVK